VHEVATGNLPGLERQVLALLRAENPEVAAKFGADGKTGHDEPEAASEGGSN
jgi:hypothetical protein